ncbi:polymeric immunoglobulin receptor-like [Misgurnus anguillicaudatus]|uniref:polymeric immunoglobulin receptor-like n=1 Tax=Misgurnus anguillicaudatus TaxID=75329 RepID=UPI003CCF1CBE
MRDCLYISLFMLHISAGCNLSNEGQRIDVIGYTGGSVLLPCSCDDPKSTVNTFTWETVNVWKNVFKHEKYRGRLELFNKTSPANLSLLISDLREEDEGNYRCTGPHRSSHSFTDVFLTVKGCDLNRRTHTVYVTGYLGESVVLPCFCTEPLAKPDQLIWSFDIKSNNYEEIYPSEHIERYKNRRKLLYQTNPGNLSLHLSSLTKEDQGVYQCSVSNGVIFIRLHVEALPCAYPETKSCSQAPLLHPIISLLAGISVPVKEVDRAVKEVDIARGPPNTPNTVCFLYLFDYVNVNQLLLSCWRTATLTRFIQL